MRGGQINRAPAHHFVDQPPRKKGRVSQLTLERLAILEAGITAERDYKRRYGIKVLCAEWGVSESTLMAWRQKARIAMASRARARLAVERTSP